KRCGEVLVLADTETIARHVDATAEAGLVVVERDQLRAFRRRQHGWGLRVAVLPHRALDSRPVEGGEPFTDVRHAPTVPRREPCARGWRPCSSRADRGCSRPGR